MSTIEAGRRAEVANPRAALVASCLVFVLSLSSLLGLGRYLGAIPGSAYADYLDILFSADTGTRWTALTDPNPAHFPIAHLLLNHIWGRLGAALAWVLSFVWPGDAGRFYGAVGLVCSAAAAGFACLAYCALRLNPRRVNLLILLPVCLLFTSNTIIAQPDHFGLSFGLLALTTLAMLPGARGAARTSLLGLTGFLCAMTTLTNGLYPALVAAIVHRDRLTWANARRFRYVILAIAAAGALVVVPVAVKRLPSLLRPTGSLGDSRITLYLNIRLLSDPLSAARYAGSALLYPAVGPSPTTWTSDEDGHVQPRVSYETSVLGDYQPLSAVAAVAWVLLLAAASWVLVRSPDLRNFALALFGWIVFNLLFHNMWGDEFFLFSPHWSWALMLVVLLGSRGLPVWTVAPAALLMLPGQLSTLDAIRRLLSP